MNEIEKWWMTLELPKFMHGDHVYAVHVGAVVECLVVGVRAQFEPCGADYEYDLQDVKDEDNILYGKTAKELYTNREEPEKIIRIADLETRAEELARWAGYNKAEQQRLMQLTPAGIKAQLEALKAEAAERESKRVKVLEELKELKGEKDAR